METEEMIVTIIGAVLGSGILNSIITHILYSNRLKKELKHRGNDMIAKKIEDSLQFARELELELTVQEIFDLSEELEVRGENVNFFGGECIYPAIFNDWSSYNQFLNKVMVCRREYEKNLSCKVALNIAFIERYLLQLSVYMSKMGAEAMLPSFGALFVFDLRKWQRKMDKMIVREINKYTYKLESHETKKWKRMRKRELVQQYEDTILCYLITGKCNPKRKKQLDKVKRIVDNIAQI